MEADRLSGDIATLRLIPLATLLPEKKPWFTLSCRLGGCWSLSGCFGEYIALLLLPRFEPKTFLFSVITMLVPRFEPQIFQVKYLSVYLICCPIMIEDNTKVCINRMRKEVSIGYVCFMAGIL